MQRKYAVNGNGQVTNGEGGEQPAAEDVLESLFQTGGSLLNEHQELLEQALAKSMQSAALKYGTPGEGKIHVRRDGFLGKKNEQDLARADAEKANHDRAILNAELLADLGKYASAGKEYVMDCVGYMTDIDTRLPDTLQPIGRVLTSQATKILIHTYTESLTMLSVMGLEENTKATKPK